jgi:UDP-3-O-[3-hydroxymyristoyl] glucosamine N-acyltransferase
MTQSLTVGQIAELIGGDVVGNADAPIGGFAPFEVAQPGQLTFAVDDKRLAAIGQSQAGAVIVPADAELEATVNLIRVPQVELAIAQLLNQFAPPADLPAAGVAASAAIAATATVAPDARIGENVVIGDGASIGSGTALCANVVVGRDATIGEDCVLDVGAVIEARSLLGDRVRVGPNTVIGYEGFGYIPDPDGHHRIEHIGNVVIEDDVDLGASVCIDRAKFGSTRIGRGTKIDNLVQIAHNVQIGGGCLIAGQVGIAGSAKLGQFCVLGGSAGIRDNTTLGDGVTVAAYSAVANDVPDGETVAGTPARNAGQMLRIVTTQMKLPEMAKRLKALEAKVNKLG